MPISTKIQTKHLSQEEFGAIAYDVMNRVFEIHRRMGRLFDEQIYQGEIARQCDGIVEFPIDVAHAGFQTTLFIDLVVAHGAVFELKSVPALHDRHRSQLMQYLYMTGLSHGKLVNLRKDTVEHEFVNTSLTLADRVDFDLKECSWDLRFPSSEKVRDSTIAILRDLGTGLDLSLYTAILTHILGGDAQVISAVPLAIDGRQIGAQKLRLSSPQSHFRFTALDGSKMGSFRLDLQRLLEHTPLDGIHWINVTRRCVTFKLIRRNGD